MPLYRTNAATFINDHMHVAGDIVETDLPPGPHLEPYVDAKGVEDQEARRRVEFMREKAPKGPGHPEYFGDMVDYYANGDGKTGARVEASSAAHPMGTQYLAHTKLVSERDTLTARLQEAEAKAAEAEALRAEIASHKQRADAAEAERDQLLSAPVEQPEGRHKGK